MDGAVVESGLAQPLHTIRPQTRRPETQVLGIVAQRKVPGAEPRAAPVTRDLIDEAIGLGVVGDSKVGDLGPEVVGMSVNSVVAPVGARHHHGHQFALPA